MGAPGSPRFNTDAVVTFVGAQGHERDALHSSGGARTQSNICQADDEGTGSDTEWSEGFSSDDEARREARPPKRVRLLTRAARELECETTEAEPGDGAT